MVQRLTDSLVTVLTGKMCGLVFALGSPDDGQINGTSRRR
jgi:hypothetical protein